MEILKDHHNSHLLPELNDPQLKELPQLSHLGKESVEPLPDPQRLRFEIVDHHTSEGIKRLGELAKECPKPTKDISERPFVSGEKEVSDLANYFAKIFEGIDFNHHEAEAHVRKQVADTLLSQTENIDAERINSVLEKNPLIKDLTWLAKELRTYTLEPDRLEKNSRWVWDPDEQTLHKTLGADARRMLAKTRLLGLVPFETVDRLRTMKIRVIGASVAASTLDLLVALGAEDVTAVDGGFLDPSNSPRMPGIMGDFRNCGKSKAHTSQQSMQGRNPDGKYLCYAGRVVFSEDQKQGSQDVLFHDLVKDADVVFEVIDYAAGKYLVRDLMADLAPDTLVGYMGDVGSRPFAGLERPGDRNHFNQNLPKDELERMKQLASITDRNMVMTESMRAVFKMVENDFPTDHRLQFLLSRMGIIPFWSQTPMSARESASIAVKELVLVLQGKKEIIGKNLHPDESPSTLVEPFNEDEINTVNELCRQGFAL